MYRLHTFNKRDNLKRSTSWTTSSHSSSITAGEEAIEVLSVCELSVLMIKTNQTSADRWELALTI